MKDTNYSVYLIKLGEEVMYVGKTTDFRRRMKEHRGRIGTRHSAIPKGVDLSEVTITKVKEFSDCNEALKYEDELIIQYDTVNNGWNKNRSGHISTSVEDRKAYMKKYSEEHRESHQTSVKKYVEAHREERKVYEKKWREANRDKINAHKREYRKRIKLNKEEKYI